MSPLDTGFFLGFLSFFFAGDFFLAGAFFLAGESSAKRSSTSAPLAPGAALLPLPLDFFFEAFSLAPLAFLGAVLDEKISSSSSPHRFAPSASAAFAAGASAGLAGDAAADSSNPKSSSSLSSPCAVFPFC